MQHERLPEEGSQNPSSFGPRRRGRLQQTKRGPAERGGEDEGKAEACSDNTSSRWRWKSSRWRKTGSWPLQRPPQSPQFQRPWPCRQGLNCAVVRSGSGTASSDSGGGKHGHAGRSRTSASASTSSSIPTPEGLLPWFRRQHISRMATCPAVCDRSASTGSCTHQVIFCMSFCNRCRRALRLALQSMLLSTPLLITLVTSLIISVARGYFSVVRRAQSSFPAHMALAQLLAFQSSAAERSAECQLNADRQERAASAEREERAHRFAVIGKPNGCKSWQ
jgi:hypothetical protein